MIAVARRCVNGMFSRRFFARSGARMALIRIAKEGAVVLDLTGDREILKMHRRAILVSRTARNPDPRTPWVRAVLDSVRTSVEIGEAIVAGIGRDPYDLALYRCRELGGQAIVVCDSGTDLSRIEWLPERVLIATGLMTPRVRDELIGDLSDRAWSIALRRGGNMEAVERKLASRGCPVDRVACVGRATSPRRRHRDQYRPAEESADDRRWSRLTHYTREPDGAWPGEPRAQYLSWLAHGPAEPRRNALASLRRILDQRRILAHSRLMPLNHPMVCFTARAPRQMADLFRWRRGLHRWTFRPYGLAVNMSVLERLGARPVQYLSREALAAASESERLFAQRHDPPRTDWSAEAEWRLPGDFEFSAIAGDELLAVVESSRDASEIENEYGIPGMAMSGTLD